MTLRPMAIRRGEGGRDHPHECVTQRWQGVCHSDTLVGSHTAVRPAMIVTVIAVVIRTDKPDANQGAGCGVMPAPAPGERRAR
jgi:hypothetical protein